MKIQTHIGCVLDVLDAAVGQGDAVLAHDVALGVAAPVLAEVGVVVVVMDPVLEGEGVGLLIIPAVMVDLRHNGGAVHSAVDYGGRGGDGVMNSVMMNRLRDGAMRAVMN